MATCDKINKCPFHSGRLAKFSPATIEGMVRMFCNGEPNRCARLLLLAELGEENVPKDLAPSDLLRARDIIREFERAHKIEKIKVTD